jgi:hypothetical protein
MNKTTNNINKKLIIDFSFLIGLVFRNNFINKKIHFLEFSIITLLASCFFIRRL